jgi:PAS domain S-box-containing protein
MKDKSEDKFFNVFDNSRVMMAISTLDSGVFINVNKKFLNTLGYSKNEVLGFSSKDLSLFHDYDQRNTAYNNLKDGAFVDGFEIKLKSKSGKLITCSFSLCIINIQSEEYLLTSAIDISRQKEDEAKIKKLYENQNLLSKIAQLLNGTTDIDAIILKVLDILGTFTETEKILIYEDSEDGLISKNTNVWCKNIYDNSDKISIDISYLTFPGWRKKLMDEGHVIVRNTDSYSENTGSIITNLDIKSALIYPLFLGDIYYGFIGYVNCLTQREWSEDDIELLKTVSNIISNAFRRRDVINMLRNSELKQKELIDSKDRLFSIISHDLRGPIGNFVSILEIVLNDKYMDEKSKNDLLQELLKSSYTTYDMLENLLTWSKNQTKNISVKKSNIDINGIIQDNIELLDTLAKQKSIFIYYNPNDKHIVFADKDSVNIIVRNLLSNAIKFTPNKGMISIETEYDGDFVRIMVNDNGIGIEKDVLENLFTSEIVDSMNGTNGEKGAGLGLSICKDFVVMNSGTINADSIRGKGSSFYFTLPKGY